MADSERLAEQALDEPSGNLRITAPLTFGTERLAPALSEFSLQNPRVKLDVVLTNRRPDLMENGLDVAFRLGALEPSNLIARPLIDYTLTMCASPEYLARRGTPQTPEDLRHHDCLSFAYPAGDDWQSVQKEWRLAGPDGEVSVGVSGPMLINSSAGLHQAALTGMGIVMMPDALVEQDLRDGKLLALMPDFCPPSRPMHLVYAQDRYRLPKLRRFVDFAVQKWGKH
ncbi:HTH-type transcriptional regulator DmlR [compost metagenome]